MALATRRFDSALKSSTLVTTDMASHFTMWKHAVDQKRAKEPDPGDRAHDAPARGARAASGAARPEADLAVHAAAPFHGAPHPVGAVGRPAGRPGRAGQLSPGHAPARARQPGEI